MKGAVSVALVAVCCALVAVDYAFTERVWAQTLTPGELRATAIVAIAQVTADAQRQRMDAPTLTPRPTLTSTNTPAPTETSTPTPTPTTTPPPTITTSPSPSATGTPIAAGQGTQVATPKRDPMTVIGILIMFGILIGVGVAIFIYSKRKAHYGE